MDKKMISQPLYKRRSLTACMENALRILRSAWWRILKASWIPLAVYAVGEAVTTASASALMPSRVGMIVGLPVMLVGCLAFFGLFYHWISCYKKTGEFVPLDFKSHLKPVLRQAVRFLVVHIPAAILIGILLYVGVYALLSLVVPAPHAVPLWGGIIALVAVLYLSIPLTVFCLDFLVGGKSYYAAFIKGMTMGTRRWGAFFALGFMVMVLYGLFSIIAGLPLELSVIIDVMNRYSMAEGNPYALPGFFPVVRFVLALLVSFVTELAFLYPLLSLILLYTSRETLLKERENYEKQQKETEKSEKM